MSSPQYGESMATRKRIQRTKAKRGPSSVADQYGLKNKSPHRAYKWVIKGRFAEQGVQFHLYHGWILEKFRKDKDGKPLGVIPTFGADELDDGSPIEYMDCTLMSCTRERAEEIAQFGWDGQSGREAVQEKERSLISRKHADPSRGITQQMLQAASARLLNDTEEPEELDELQLE